MITGLAIAAAFRWVRGSDSGVFGDAGRHMPVLLYNDSRIL